MKKKSWRKQEMKNMRILIDTNVIVDFILKRNHFSDDAEKIIELCIEEKLQGCIAAHSIPNLFYILRKYLTVEERKDILLRVCKIFTVVGIDINKLNSALQNNDFNDFEDCLQVECAKDFDADFIVTRDMDDFISSIIPVIKPVELIKMLSK